ncbi:hypothetical protein EUZ85_15520 [Hahella sp. KA22]|uniref:hypothetical protein n=1 Tax=Hahella sp. KA22 TaxID=1628392 RepID=UPI000FDE21DB|nr:hypothetical protein [Hahella sp. KA22]AZZ92057.1 hypothetical protein ENC22_12955 [Hahella sp. KA22]QAY55428.1 hypothetical protein EUZ85_15520 [Hahella sp. KA22]
MATTEEKKESSARSAAGTTVTASSALDFGDLKNEWSKLLEKQRPDAESNLLKVNVRASKIDPLAEAALSKVKEAYSTNENTLRKLITRKGWATELDRVIKRINSLRISESKRVVLAAVYPALLNKLLSCSGADEEVKDEMGFTDSVLFELEREDGPLDRFAQEVVKLVGAKHRINFAEDNVLCDLIAHQVRAGL